MRGGTLVVPGDCRDALAALADRSVQCCVTSPPYYGLRDYGVDGQIGLEQSPDEYVAEMVGVMREVRRVLRDDGTLWLNLGDSYRNLRTPLNGGVPTNTAHVGGARDGTEGFGRASRNWWIEGVKGKDLIGIPWMVAFALRADGWYLRADIIWHKPNPMPESVRDRPTKAHEYVFLLAKSARYFYDADAITEPAKTVVPADRKVSNAYSEGSGRFDGGKHRSGGFVSRGAASDKQSGHSRRHAGFNARWDALTPAEQTAIGANARSVWSISPKPFAGAHFATMPPALAERCVLAGSRPGDMVLDPFGGAGTTALVANRHSRHCLMIELNPTYAEMARNRLAADKEQPAYA